ncbi:MAG: hypothetical protein M3Y27_03915, partial [Acidobacteriota bacterium]|nr:hypothetical protein [Acidobacteriota bacterium]
MLSAIEELAYRFLDVPSSTPWPAFAGLVILMRVAAIGIAGPVAEEFVFRGLAFAWIRRTRLGAPGAVLVT